MVENYQLNEWRIFQSQGTAYIYSVGPILVPNLIVIQKGGHLDRAELQNKPTEDSLSDTE